MLDSTSFSINTLQYSELFEDINIALAHVVNTCISSHSLWEIK